MQTVAASVILDDAYRLMRWDVDLLEDSEIGDARMAFSLALQEVWEAWWWAELMECEQRPLRDEYDADVVYVAGEQVYFPATRKYYQALQRIDPVYEPGAPEILENGDYALNDAFWVECALSFSGEDYDATETYEVGDAVRNPDNDSYYARLAGLRSTGAGLADANTDWQHKGSQNDRRRYGLGVNPDLAWTGIAWNLVAGVIGHNNCYDGLDDVATPDLVTNWDAVVGGGGVLPSPTFITQAPPPDLLFWGLLRPFSPTLELAGEVRMVSEQDPRTTRNPGELDFERTTTGILIPGLLEGKPWVWSRRVTPVITGEEFDADEAYEATPTDDLVFDS